MFPGCGVDYGFEENRDYTRSVKEARQLNPMEDKQISELVFDVLCLIYSADWYKSCDTGEKTYRDDVKFFKEKWLKVKPEDAIRDEIDKSIKEAKEALYKDFGLIEVEEE